MGDRTGRKVIVKDKRFDGKTGLEVSIVPTLDALVSDAMSIIGAEMSYYKTKTKSGARLDAKEAKIIRDYVEALVKLSREAREATLQQDLSSLSNEEVLKWAAKLLTPTENRGDTLNANCSESTSNQVVTPLNTVESSTENQVVAESTDDAFFENSDKNE